MYYLQSIKDTILPDIGEAVKRLKQADQPDPEQRDVRPLMAILAKMSQALPRLRGHVLTRRVAISAFGWKLVPYNAADADRAILATQRLRRIITRLLQWHTMTPMFGASAVEITWDTSTSVGTQPKILRRYHPTEIERVDDDPFHINILLDGDTINRKAVATDDPRGWLVDVDESMQMTGGILRSLIFHEILLNESLQEWHWFNLKLKGIIQAQLEEWAGDEDKAAAAAQLRQVATNNYSLTSTAVQYKFNQVTDAAGSGSFKAFKDALESDRAITILGQANTTELPNGGGSRAALQVLQLISADIHYDDMQRIETQINDQLLLHDWQMNSEPSAVEAPWRFQIDLSEETDREKEARTISELLASGVPLLKSEVYGRTGFTVPEPGAAVVEPKSTGGF